MTTLLIVLGGLAAYAALIIFIGHFIHAGGSGQ